MNSHQRISAAALITAASLSFSPAAWSLGLGDARVDSFLNQPLKARIDLISGPTDDLATVTARLASAADYELIGASLDSVPVPVRFTVEDIDGDAYLLASSNLPISEPVVRLIVEVNWSSGRMLREYTLFLDPATVAEPAPPPRIDTRTSTVTAPAAAAPAPTVTAPADEPVAAASSDREPEAVRGGEYGPVRSGETLWRIASDWASGTGLGVNQAMIAIQRENPEAFLNGNINLLKRGAILRLPRVEDVEAISRATARAEVAAQEQAFSARTSAATVASPATPLLAAESAPAPAEPAPEQAPEAEPAAEAEPEEAETAAGIAEEVAEVAEVEEPRGQLELVPPLADSEVDGELDSEYGFEEPVAAEAETAEGDVRQLRENLARTEEELINQQQQNAYLEDRLRELESQLAQRAEDAVADADLANMEDRLREQRETQPPAAEPWYRSVWAWVIGLVVLLAAGLGWLLSRRGRAEEVVQEAAVAAPLREIQDEAEDVLRVLREEAPAAAAPAAPVAEAEEEPVPANERKRRHQEDAEILDEDSSDPEIQLDLARAYISMGDKEAARVILQEVMSNGNDAQRDEARKMLEVLTSP